MLFGVYIFGVAHSCQEKTAILLARAVNFAFCLQRIYSRLTAKIRRVVASSLVQSLSWLDQIRDLCHFSC
jgi:hypothetical protein